MIDLEIIVPVLNEEDTVEPLVKRIHAAMITAGIKYRLLFVDDHSTDKTVDNINSLKASYPISLLMKMGEKGKAYSILEGVRKSKAEYVAMIDGDLQYPPEALPEMYKLGQKHAVVVANRRKSNISWPRRFLSSISANIFGRLLLGLNCDVQSGLKLFKREIVTIDEKDVAPWALDMPLLINALNLGESIGITEIDFSARESGKSKVNIFKTSVEIALIAFKLKFKKKTIHRIKPHDGQKMQGAGVIHKRRKFITHTTLPENKSALYTLSSWQKSAIFSVLLLFVAGLLVNYLATLIVIVAVLSFIYFADVIFSGYVLIKSLHFPPELKFTQEEIDSIDESSLPIYTILCPLYREGRVLPQFIESINNLDWPKQRLDVIILLEEDDEETFSVAQGLNMPECVRVVVVPDSQPRTKPKACNYGLSLAKGEYTVVYDAEDRPEPLQLKKAYLGFRKTGKKTFCLQSKLNYYNPNGNLLTRLFTAEYSLWFDVILPGLQSIESAIPLGGTSNHFITNRLVDLHAWDPFNVTEDCDLGVRIFKAGYKTAIIDSTTLEEANSSVRNWIRQRSRWIKGYIQTYLVHTREPILFIKEHGRHAFTFQLIIGMRMSFMLINPFLWVMTISYFALRGTVGVAIESLYPAAIFYIASFALVVGNFMYIYNYMIGCAKRGHYNLIKYVFFVPLYWLLASVAAFKAVHQLVFKPHFWEKTNHGLDQKTAKIENHAARFTLEPVFSKINLTSGASLVIASVLSNFLNFVTSAYLGRVLLPGEFGLIALMSSFLFLAQVFSSSVYQTISHQTAFLEGKYGKPTGLIWKNVRPKLFKLSLVLLLLWVVLTPVLPLFFKSNTVVPFMVFAPLWVALTLNAVDSGFIQGRMKFHFLAIIVVLEALSKLLFSLLLVNVGLVDWVYAALPLSTFVNLIIGYTIARHLSRNEKINDKTKIAPNDSAFNKGFFGVATLTQLSTISFLSLDLLAVKHFLNPEEAGQYALLVLSGRIVFMVGGLFSQFILPLSSHAKGAQKNSNKIFTLLLSAVVFSSSAAFVFIGLLGNFTVPLLFGENAKTIIPYVIQFSGAMVLFSIGSGIVTYHQAKRQYVFALTGIISALFQGFMLLMFHQNILQVVNVMSISSVFYLITSLVMHFLGDKVDSLGHNLVDLWDLFLMKFNGRKPLDSGKLRILMFNWRDTKHVWAGGAEAYVHENAKRWAREGHKVTVFCGNDGKNKRNDEIDGVRIIRHGGFYTVYLWAFLYYVLRFRKRFDVLIESENGVPFFTPLYSRLPKILIIHHVNQEIFRKHLPWILAFVAKFVEGRLMPLVYRNTQMVTVSKSSKLDMERLGIGGKRPVVIINPGVDPELLKPGIKAKRPTLVYLGRLMPYKSIDTMVKATKILVNSFPDIEVKIAGFGESRYELEKLVRKLKLTKSIKFLGRVTEQQKVKLLSEAWVFVQPSTMEGWGISVVEANACGTPVVASRVPGLVDSVKNPYTGFTVSPKDEKEFAGAIARLLADDKLRNKFSKNSIEWAKKFGWDEKSGEFMNVLQNVIKHQDGTNAMELARVN